MKRGSNRTKDIGGSDAVERNVRDELRDRIRGLERALTDEREDRERLAADNQHLLDLLSKATGLPPECAREGGHKQGIGEVCVRCGLTTAPPILSREEGIERCTRAGFVACRVTDWQFCRAADVLAGNPSQIMPEEFAPAVLTEARRLVSTGECPSLANEPALRGSVPT